MDGWWDELDAEILAILKAAGPMETAELATKLRLSVEATGSCLAMLAASGRVRFLSVELSSRARVVQDAA